MEEVAETGWRSLLVDAGGRHGAFHLRRCAEHGLNASTVRARAQREGWHKPYPAVFCLPGSVEGWWRTSAARLEVVGSDAALGRRSAAHAHGMLRRPPVTTEIAREAGRHVPNRPLITVSTARTLTDADIEVVDGLRCTTPHRTMRDLSRLLSEASLRAVGIEGLRVGVLDLAALVGEVDAMQGGPARRLLASVADDLARVRTESPFAYEVLEAVAEAGFEVEGEFPWRCPDGRIIHHDGALPALWVAIECDGRRKYATGRSFTTDRIRWTQTSGSWRTIWTDLDRWRSDRAGVLADVQRAAREADPSRPPAERAPCRCVRCKRWGRRRR